MEDFEHDRPVINLALSVSQAMLVQSALNMLGYACESDLKSVAVYLDSAPTLASVEECDRLSQSLADQIQPFARDTYARIKALAEERRREIEESED
jgi:hypothetical protein